MNLPLRRLVGALTVLFSTLVVSAAAEDAQLAQVRARAEQGDAAAMVELGKALEFEEPQEALQWFRRAAGKGNLEGQFLFFDILGESAVGDDETVAEALKYLRAAANSGHAPSQLEVGRIYSGQHTVTDDDPPPNYPEAAKWIRKAAEQKLPEAMYEWGLLLVQGKGEIVPKDFSTGLNFIRKGALAGCSDAQVYLTALYTSGVDDFDNTVARDQEERLRWLRLRAEGGDSTAMYSLAEHFEALPQPTDAERAEIRTWLEKAAASSHVGAQQKLAALNSVAKPAEPAPIESTVVADSGAAAAAGVLASLGETPEQAAAREKENAAQVAASNGDSASTPAGDEAAAGPGPGVTIIKIPGEDQAIKAVRYFGGWYVAIGEATQKDGVWQAKVWFSRDARAWEHRFTASEPLDDIIYASYKGGTGGRFLLILSDSSRNGWFFRKDMPTWMSTNEGRTWEEIRGENVRYAASSVEGDFVASGSRNEGGVSHEQVKVSRDAREWINYEQIPAEFAAIRPLPQWDGRQMFDGRVYKSASHQSATWAILSSNDLQNWTEECLIPAPAAGKERETNPHVCASEDTLLAGTMVAMGDGPVRFYRKTISGEGWERITPDLPWNYLHGLSYAGGRFVAVASREDLRVSKDGLRWKVVATVRPYSPRFAVDPEGNYVFGGAKGAIAIVTPDKSWDDFSSIGEPTIQTGANWENESTKQDADDYFALAAALGASGPNPDAQRFLLQAVAVAETGNPENRLRLGMMLIQGSLGVPKDVERGIRLIASSAESGFALARLTYGMALINGANGLVPIDAAKGTELLQAAVRDADTADAEAKFQLAALLLQGGPGIPADRARGFALLGAAADGGFAPAQFNYGQALLAGSPEVPADFPRGLQMLKNAANQKVPQAAALLGQIYEAGQGVTADLKEAKGWYALAVNLGFKPAVEALQRVEAKLESDSAP